MIEIPSHVPRQIDSAIYTLIRPGPDGIDGGEAGDNMVPYRKFAKTKTTAWRSRMSNLDTIFLLAGSRLRVGSVPRAGMANLYFLGFTDELGLPDAPIHPFTTLYEFEDAAWEALNLVLGKTLPKAAQDASDLPEGDLPVPGPPEPQEAALRLTSTPKTCEFTRIGTRTISRAAFLRMEAEEDQGKLF